MQTRLPDELVICDDLSTDSSRKLIEAFAAGAPFPVRLHVNEKNVGSTKNFEKAIRLCSGEVIALSDQDDIWEAEKLKRIETEFLSRDNVGLLFTDGEVVDQDLRPLGWRIWQTVQFSEKKQRLFREGKAFRILLDRNIVTGATMAFRAHYKELVLPIPTNIMHDGWKVIHDGWVALTIAAVADLAFIPEPLIKYRQHPQQQLGVLSALRLDADRESSSGVASLRAAAQRKNSFAQEIHYLETIHQRLSTKGCTFFASKDIIPELEARTSHFKARAGMAGGLLNRVPSVLKELVTLRYHLYSNGLSSAAKDLLR